LAVATLEILAITELAPTFSVDSNAAHVAMIKNSLDTDVWNFMRSKRSRPNEEHKSETKPNKLFLRFLQTDSSAMLALFHLILQSAYFD
jgi:hypothetical protein